MGTHPGSFTAGASLLDHSSSTILLRPPDGQPFGNPVAGFISLIPSIAGQPVDGAAGAGPGLRGPPNPEQGRLVVGPGLVFCNCGISGEAPLGQVGPLAVVPEARATVVVWAVPGPPWAQREGLAKVAPWPVSKPPAPNSVRPAGLQSVNRGGIDYEGNVGGRGGNARFPDWRAGKLPARLPRKNQRRDRG